jgi:hypothetical protein
MSTCNGAGTWCGVVGHDINGYWSGVPGEPDAGVMYIDPAIMTNYPGWYARAWSSIPYAILGTENAMLGTTLCKNGATT